MGPVRDIGVVTALVILAGSLFLTLSRIFTPAPRIFVLAAAFAPYALVGYAASLALLLVGGQHGSATALPIAVLVAVAGLVLHASWLAPLYLGRRRHGPPELRVMTLNMWLGKADPVAVVALARAREIDVLVLEEVTPRARQGLVAIGVLEDWPYTAGGPRPVAEGTVVLSRYPLTGEEQLPILNGAFRVRVEAPTPFTLLATHTVEPLRDAPGWRQDHQALHAAARTALAVGPTMVVGDLNTTPDQRPVRALCGLGLRSAAQQAGAGFRPTWPSDRRVAFGLPFGVSLITLDHVLLSPPYVAVSARTVVVRGTDHRALVAGLVVDEAIAVSRRRAGPG